jgi:hypothetical protein
LSISFFRAVPHSSGEGEMYPRCDEDQGGNARFIVRANSHQRTAKSSCPMRLLRNTNRASPRMPYNVRSALASPERSNVTHAFTPRARDLSSTRPSA